MDNKHREENVRLARAIGHLITIINCKNTEIFANHQKHLKEKYY